MSPLPRDLLLESADAVFWGKSVWKPSVFGPLQYRLCKTMFLEVRLRRACLSFSLSIFPAKQCFQHKTLPCNYAVCIWIFPCLTSVLFSQQFRAQATYQATVCRQHRVYVWEARSLEEEHRLHFLPIAEFNVEGDRVFEVLYPPPSLLEGTQTECKREMRSDVSCRTPSNLSRRKEASTIWQTTGEEAADVGSGAKCPALRVLRHPWL